MTDPVAALRDALARERAAALQADLPVLTEVQEAKRAAIAALASAGLSESDHEELTQAMNLNLRLINGLSQCLRAMCMPPDAAATYDARGGRATGYGPSGKMR